MELRDSATICRTIPFKAEWTPPPPDSEIEPFLGHKVSPPRLCCKQQPLFAGIQRPKYKVLDTRSEVEKVEGYCSIVPALVKPFASFPTRPLHPLPIYLSYIVLTVAVPAFQVFRYLHCYHAEPLVSRPVIYSYCVLLSLQPRNWCK